MSKKKLWEREVRSDAAMVLAVLVLGISLIYSGCSLLQLRWQSIRTGQPLDLPELLGVAGAGIGAALLLWWLLALSCALISAFAQALGAARLAHTTASFSPAFMRRLVAAVLGLNLLTAPLAMAGEGPAIDPSWHADVVATAPGLVQSTPDPAASATQAPEAISIDPQWMPTAPTTDPGLLVTPATRTPEMTPAEQPRDLQEPVPAFEQDLAEGQVVVKRGDSLWSIAAAALGPYADDVAVALEWPRWYQSNREIIGSNPNLILPGTILHSPNTR